MKDRIGQSNKKKKTPTDPNVSGVTGVPKPESFAGFSEDEKPPKKSKLPSSLTVSAGNHSADWLFSHALWLP